MRIAWVTPYLPAPANSGGRIRITRFVESLSGNEIELFVRLGKDDPPLESMRSSDLTGFETIHSEREARAMGTLRTPGLPRSFPSGLHARLAERHQQRPFDAVIAEHCYSVRGLPRLAGAPLVLNEHNVESDYWAGEFRSKHSPHLLFEYARWRSFEARMWNVADAVTAVSQRDATRIEKIRRPCLVVPNGISLESYEYRAPSSRRGNSILFVGMMSYEPNVLAANVLAREVLPRVKERYPDASLTLAGRDPSPRVRCLANDSIRVTGTLADLRSIFSAHAVYANPVRFGGGSSLKVLEPLAAGLPLVAGDFATRGFDLVDGRQFLRADDNDSMVDCICRVLESRFEFDEMAERARVFAAAHAWSVLTKPFVDLVVRAAAGQLPTSDGRDTRVQSP